MIGRTGLHLRQGLFELHAYNALITRKQALDLLKQKSDANEGLREDDHWSIQQYQKLLAFPLLTASEQVDALAATSVGSSLLLDLMSVLKPLEASTFESRLEAACVSCDEHLQSILLAFAAESNTPLSKKACDLVVKLSVSQAAKVRTQALSIIARYDDVDMSADVARGEWCASDGEKSHYYEDWYGSIALLNAAQAGIISFENALVPAVIEG